MKRSRNISLIVSLGVGLLVVAGVLLALVQAPRGAAQEAPAPIQYPEYPPTPTIGPNPTAAAQLAGAGTLLYASDFADASALSAWTPMDLSFVLPGTEGQWAVTEGRLAQDYAGAARDRTTQEVATLTGAASWSDYSAQVSFYDEFNGTVGLLARYSGSDPTTASYYRVRVLSESYEATPKLVLERVDQGAATQLVAIKGPGFSERTWHTLRLTVVGGSVVAALDGQVVAEATDGAPLPAGQAGIYTRASGGILFDDFSVTAP